MNDVRFTASKKKKSKKSKSGRLSDSDLKDCSMERGTGIELQLGKSSELTGLAGQQYVYAFEGKEAVLTARTNQEPDK